MANEQVYYSALHYAAKAKKSEEKAAEYLQQVGNKVTAVEGSIGDIGIAPLGIDESQNKRRYLNGQVISQSQFESFTKKIKEAVAVNSNLATSETNWQAEVTNSKLGQCGKFVIDNALGTIRLPKVVNVQGLTDLTLMGSIKAESLPNITGNVDGGQLMRTDVGGSHAGALYRFNSSNGSRPKGEGGSTFGIGLDASFSSSTYQDNAPVQQEAIQYPYFIQVATGVEETVDVTREIELNNPFSLLEYKWSEYEITNASWLISNGSFHSGATYVAVYELLLKIYNGTETKDGVSVKLVSEEYSDTDFVLNTADMTFRLPIKVKLASGNAVVGNGMSLGLTNGANNFGLITGAVADAEGNSYYLGNSANAYGGEIGGTGSTKSPSIDVWSGITTDPTKSGIETSSQDLYLYFYVGETVQDANIIVSSNVLTEIANLKGYAAGMPDYTAGVSVTSTYTAPKDGILYVRNIGGSGSTDVIVTVNNVAITSLIWYAHDTFELSKGDIVSFTGSYEAKFFPFKGAK